jgi:hypothetical protein
LVSGQEVCVRISFRIAWAVPALAGSAFTATPTSHQDRVAGLRNALVSDAR